MTDQKILAIGAVLCLDEEIINCLKARNISKSDIMEICDLATKQLQFENSKTEEMPTI